MPSTSDSVDALNKRFTVNTISTSLLSSTSFYKTILSNGYPIVVGMPLYDSFVDMWNNPLAHGVWSSADTTDYDHNAAGHASCIIGYDDMKESFKVMNSWGTSGGDAGFYWIKYNLVQQGVFRDALFVVKHDSAKIEGPDTLKIGTLSDSAWYYIHYMPENATITWTITNQTLSPSEYVLVSPQGKDSMYVAYRPITIHVGPKEEKDSPDEDERGLTFYQWGHLDVTINSGTTSYTVRKTIRRPTGSPSFPHLMPDRSARGVDKILRDGQIYILRGDHTYTLTGQEIE